MALSNAGMEGILSSQTPAERLEPAAGRSEESPRILLAEHNAGTRDFVVGLLSERYETIAVAGAEAAFAAVCEQAPDLILSDAMMPQLDGLIERLRAHPPTSTVPIILLCARTGEDARVEELQHGADDYLIQPFSAHELLARIGAHLDLNGARKAAAQALLRSNEELECRVRERTKQLEEANEALRRSFETALRLQQISTKLIAAGDGKALYEQILDAAVATVHADFASMQVLHPERGHGGELRLLSHRGFSAHATAFWEWVSPDSSTSCGMTLRTRRRAVITNVENCDFLAGTGDLETFREAGIRAVQTTPLLSRTGALLGVFSTHWREPRTLAEDEEQVLDVLARLAADLIERTQTEERLRENEARQAFLLKLSDALRPLADPLQIQVEAMRVLGEHLGASRVKYAEVDGDGKTFRVHADFRRQGVASTDGIDPLNSFGAHAAEGLGRGRTFVLADATRIAALAEKDRAACASLGIAAMVSVPLIKAGRMAALLAVHQTEPRVWTPAEVALIEETAERTWAAVERARSEAALRESEEKYRRLFESMEEGFGICELVRDGAGRAVDFLWVELNPRVERLTGVRDEQLIGRRASETLAGSVLDWWVRKFEDVAGAGESTHFERYVKQFERWIDCRVYPYGGDRVAVLCDDITERKRAEQALAESERQFRALVNASSEVLYRMSPDWTEMRELGGAGFLSGTVRPSRDWLQHYIDPDDQPRVLAAIQKAVRTKSVFELEHRVRRADGTLGWTLSRAVPLLDANGEIREWFGAASDVTERKMAEERLRQAQKLESIGLLAGGIAHDFNNLLTTIMGNASMLLDGDERHQPERVETIIRVAERGSELTRQLLAYAGKGQVAPRDLDISHEITELSDLLQSSIPKSVGLKINLEKRLPPVRMDSTHLQQIVMNLVINAGEAIGEGRPGGITLSTSMAETVKSFVDATGREIAAGRYVSIEIADTGAGMDEDTRSKIFDPFFSTKFTGRGLGLAAVAGIVRTQKGAITVETEPGAGSRFRVLLPASEHRMQVNGRKVRATRRATVLVIDDEPGITEFISSAISRRGYRPLVASDGREALAVCARENGTIDAAIVDVVMPKMGAKELLPALRSSYPNIRILLTSGFGESEARRLSAAYPGIDFIQKPYTGQQIVKALQDLLKRKG